MSSNFPRDPSDNLWLNARFRDDPDKIKLYLDNGADPNYSPSSSSSTVLQAAAENGDARIIKMLIEARADLHKQKPIISYDTITHCLKAWSP